MNESEKKTVKRNLLTSALCLIMLLLMLLSSTLAWFTDSKHNVNTMVAGKISISQTETDAQGNPFVGTNFVMMPNAPITKNVTVTNDGNQPAYVRTLFAFEDSEDGSVLAMLTTAGQNIVIPGVNAAGNKAQFTVIKDGKTTLFTVGYYLHTTALSHEDDQDDITVLNSITLKGEATNAWQTAVGDYYELIVLSQASQVAGLGDDAGVALDTAFDVISGASCAKWFALVLNGTVNGTTITVNP